MTVPSSPVIAGTPEQPSSPDFLASIRVSGGRLDGKEIVVVKRGGDPVHVSEVIPDALRALTGERPAA